MENDNDDKNQKGIIKKRKILTEVFEDYCNNSSLHGIGYVGAKDKNIFEKIWWILVFILSLILCAILIGQTWMKWKNSPVIVSFNKEQTPIWKIPFPAVTICPINKINKFKYNYTEMFRQRDNLTNDELEYFWDISLLCNLEYYDFSSENANNFTSNKIIENFLQVSSNVDDTINYVSWQFDETENFFVYSLTEEGICFTFNSLGQDDMFINQSIKFINHNIKNEYWNIEKGYSPKADMNTYPRRTAQDGLSFGLSIYLRTNLNDMEELCGIPVLGYKVILHNPAEIPRTSQQYILVPFGRQTTVAIKPEVITTSAKLLTVPSSIRKCYFSNEKSLKFYKIYTQDNCRMECLANLSLSLCGCVPFYVPRENGTKICGYGSLSCNSEIIAKVSKYEMPEKKNENDKELKIYKECDCLPSCSSLHYSSETSQAPLHIQKIKNAMKDINSIDDNITSLILNDNVGLTIVDIFFKETQFLTLHRSELFGQTDFLANCGGLLGLFMGFSVLSFLEIIYFLTIRIWFKCTTNKKSNNSCK